MLTFLEQFQFMTWHNDLSGIISVNWQDPFESPARVLLYRNWSRFIRILALQFVLQNRSETLRQRCGSIYRSENHPPPPKNILFQTRHYLFFSSLFEPILRLFYHLSFSFPFTFLLSSFFGISRLFWHFPPFFFPFLYFSSKYTGRFSKIYTSACWSK